MVSATSPLGAPTARDADTLDLLNDFRVEATEGLATADENLLALEHHATGPEAIERIHAVFRAFHSMKGVAGFLELDDIGRVAHLTENLLNAVRSGSRPLVGETLELVLDSTALTRELLTWAFRAVETRTAFVSHPAVPALAARIEASISNPDAPAPTPEPEREPKREPERERDEEAAVAPEAAGAAGANAAGGAGRETVKVDVERVDGLVDLVGEMLVAQAMLTGAPELEGVRKGQLDAALSELARISAALQDTALRMRMLPVRGLLRRLTRFVRELSRKTGKELRLETYGDATEIDRHMTEKIEDALVHLLRNAADHGIEPAEERLARGKPAAGTIQVRAFPANGTVVVEVEDDGRGLDPEKIFAKARERNLVRPGERPTDADVYRLIFLPGFSTASGVTDISGRGVGMDVVKRNIDALRGHVRVHSELGKGTIVRLELPLTLALQEGMAVSRNGATYVVPTTSVDESIEIAKASIVSLAGEQRFIDHRGALVPLYSLDVVLGEGREEGPSAAGVRALALIVRSGERRLALAVDDVASPAQYVVKPVAAGLRSHRFGGATILPDGTVALIVNVDGLALHELKAASPEAHP